MWVGGVRAVLVQALPAARAERQAAARLPAVLRRAQPRESAPSGSGAARHHSARYSSSTFLYSLLLSRFVQILHSTTLCEIHSVMF